ncbi:Hira-domain-containing protein [Periconia macrospinosa]|uniref:Protein HIR n=1 Tax=Periconia macrospinosa TaxID=97972 RepID=A0A2V1DH18_9PLEO|nr:Hira-domain-containing protein [Periconia macrospinosa]
MHLIKPSWLTHPGDLKDFEVYSCHVSPDGSRLATAAGDGHVRIWSTDAILNSHDPNYTKPKQLAAISNHSGTIHTVRFSPNGKYLASGADDKFVCVYALDPNAPAHVAFGSNEVPPVENWRVTRRLVGHDNDVQDLGWSYDSSILVSVGLDSKVVVWSGHTFEKLKTLSNHQSHVKGITFDPANKYFATAGDDRSVKVFRFTSPSPQANSADQVNNFMLETTITAPFAASPLTTYFRRCSWSPDGVHIAAANATNGPVSSVAILPRGAWNGEINLVGHEAPVEVCAFSPRLFYRHNPSTYDPAVDGNQFSVTVVACAGQDKCLSVWNTSYARPFMVTQELANKSISDLAWAPGGETLFVTSLDGSITTLVFEAGELGYPAPMQENEASLSRYGLGRRTGIIEGTDALLLEESAKNGELKEVQGRMGALMGDGGVTQPALVQSTQSSHSNDTNGTVAPNPLPNGSTPAPPPAEPAPDQRVEKLKQRVTMTKDGKKRIAPMLVSSSSAVGQSSLPQTQLISATTTGGRSDNPHNILDLSKPYDGYPKGGLSSLLLGNKRRFAEIEGDEDRQVEKRLAASVRPGGAAIVLNSESGLIPPAAAPPKSNETEVPKVLRPAIVSPALSVSQVRLAVPKVRSIILRTMDGSEPPQANGVSSSKPDTETIILEARNATGPSRTGRPQDHDPCRISCTKKGQSLWQDFLPRAVLLTTGNANFFAAACEDGSVYAWTPAGRRTINAMILDAQPVIMDCRGWWLLVISAVGICHVWNLQTMSAPQPPVSLAPILDIAAHSQGPHLVKSPGIVFARLNSEGRIVVAMSDGHGYVYSPMMYIWQRISEPWWAVGSQYWNTTDSSVGNVTSSEKKDVASVEEGDRVTIENVSAGIIPTLERNTTNQFLLQGRAFYLSRLIKALISAEGYETFEASISVAHLENRVAAARALGAKEEFKIYLSMYVKRIGAEGMKGKIEELLRSLSSGLVEEDENEDAASAETICGWRKEDLLRETIVILGKFRDLQRITVPYARLLGIIHEEHRGDQPMVTDM